MNITISFKHMEHTPALDEKISEKTSKLAKFLNANSKVQWVCWVEEHDHWAEVLIHTDQGDYFGKASGESMYKTIDKVVEKLLRQLEKQKKQNNRIHKSAHTQLESLPFPLSGTFHRLP